MNHKDYIEKRKKESQKFKTTWEKNKNLRKIVSAVITERINQNLSVKDMAEITGLDIRTINNNAPSTYEMIFRLKVYFFRYRCLNLAKTIIKMFFASPF